MTRADISPLRRGRKTRLVRRSFSEGGSVFRVRGTASWLILVAVLFLPASSSAAGFSTWGAIVVAGDWHAHSGAPSEVFDNARRDIAATLVGLGIKPENVLQFSMRPELYPKVAPAHSDPGTIANALWDLSNRTSGGCFAYFTSHGSQDGLALNDDVLAPQTMAQMLNNACGDRPTVVIVSACYSGVFVPALASPNRFVFTAARPDRTSFGCGETDKYTFFDTCVMQDFRTSGDFPDLAREVEACVSAREKKEGVYPSEPQLAIGSNVAKSLPTWK